MIKRVRLEYILAGTNALKGLLFSFVLSVIVARLLTVEERGELQYLITLSTILSTCLSFGLPFSLSYFENKQDRKAWERQIFFFSLLLVALVSFLVSYGGEIGSIIIIFFNVCFFLFYYIGERFKTFDRATLYSKTIIIQPLACIMGALSE
ncbi:oligosaccharide flippase family protein [Endozoicomonas sp.]|uniref:oligosaccharide flippase family protein n=1 Tax=Endozoicomonas sp. TaxID=1892382 RepID=UPI003AF476AC